MTPASLVVFSVLLGLCLFIILDDDNNWPRPNCPEYAC